MTIRVAVNGFGRIGRSVFRILSERSDMDLVAINDISPSETLAYLLKYDTVMGIFAKDVHCEGDRLVVDDQTTALSQIPDPAELPWKKLGIDVVVESTGVFRERTQLEKHLSAGATRALLTVPPKDPVDAMVVIGVNDAAVPVRR